MRRMHAIGTVKDTPEPQRLTVEHVQEAEDKQKELDIKRACGSR
jgi:hypothetical protein